MRLRVCAAFVGLLQGPGVLSPQARSLWSRLVCAVPFCLPGCGVDKPADTPLGVTSVEPRAFGYQLGDVMTRSLVVHVPAGLALEESSVPRPGARGAAFELRGLDRRSGAEGGGRRIEMTLRYQVFLSPPQVRTLETPTFVLRFQGAPRDQELRIEGVPVTVAPLVPVEVSPRRGLGELQPDVAPPPIATRPGRVRLLAYAGALLLLAGYLAHVYLGLTWRARSKRPFAQAWRALRVPAPEGAKVQRREAFRRLHDALNRTADEVVFESNIERFIAAQPRFAPLRADLDAFFARSRREFFADAGPGEPDRRWLIDFCRRCRDAERGTA